MATRIYHTAHRRARSATAPLIDVEAIRALTGRDHLSTMLAAISGPPRGRRWHCPQPSHPDLNPSASLYRSDRGGWRWHCHSCGSGGGIVDLILLRWPHLGTAEALQEAARLVGAPALPGPPAQTRPRPHRPRPARLGFGPDPLIERWALRDAVRGSSRTAAKARADIAEQLSARRWSADIAAEAGCHPARRRWNGIDIATARWPCYGIDGHLAGWQDRPLDTRRAGAKWISAPGQRLHAFGCEQLRDAPSGGAAILVEGVSDAVAARTALAGSGIPVVAALGAGSLPSVAAAILASEAAPARLLVFADADAGGLSAVRQLPAACGPDSIRIRFFAASAGDADLADRVAAEGADKIGGLLADAVSRAEADRHRSATAQVLP